MKTIFPDQAPGPTGGLQDKNLWHQWLLALAMAPLFSTAFQHVVNQSRASTFGCLAALFLCGIVQSYRRLGWWKWFGAVAVLSLVNVPLTILLTATEGYVWNFARGFIHGFAQGLAGN